MGSSSFCVEIHHHHHDNNTNRIIESNGDNHHHHHHTAAAATAAADHTIVHHNNNNIIINNTNHEKDHNHSSSSSYDDDDEELQQQMYHNDTFGEKGQHQPLHHGDCHDDTDVSSSSSHSNDHDGDWYIEAIDNDDDNNDDILLVEALRNIPSLDHDIVSMIHYQSARQRDTHNGRYPLHEVCARGCCRHDDDHVMMMIIIEKLLELFPEAIKLPDHLGNLPLHLALLSPSEQTILTLLERYPDAAKQPLTGMMMTSSSFLRGSTALHVALQQHHPPPLIIQKLLQIHPMALYEIDDHYGHYPIHTAIYHYQSIEIIQMIIAIDPTNILWQRTKKDGNTPLHIACQKNHLRLVEYIVSLCSDDNPIINARNHRQETPFHLACRYGSKRLVEVLIQHRFIDVNVLDQFHNTILHHCILQDDNDHHHKHDDDDHDECDHDEYGGERRMAVARFLLRHGTILFHLDRRENINHETPLDMIVRYIHQLRQLYDDNFRTLALPSCIDMKKLLIEHMHQRKTNTYDYLLYHHDDWGYIVGSG